MSKKSRQSQSKKLKALRRMQRFREMLKLGGMQNQAILDSAGESRPTDESHVAELLEGEEAEEKSASRTRPKVSKKHQSRKRRSRR